MKILPLLLALCINAKAGGRKRNKTRKNNKDSYYSCAVCDLTQKLDVFNAFEDPDVDANSSDDSQSSSASTSCPASDQPKKCAKGCYLKQDITRTINMGCIEDEDSSDIQDLYQQVENTKFNQIFKCGQTEDTLCLICRGKKNSPNDVCNEIDNKLELTSPATTSTTTTTTTLSTIKQTSTTTEVVVPELNTVTKTAKQYEINMTEFISESTKLARREPGSDAISTVANTILTFTLCFLLGN